MAKRSVVRLFVAISLSLAILCVAVAPAQAAGRNPGDPDTRILWSGFFDLVASWLGLAKSNPVPPPTNNGGGGGGGNGTNSICPPNLPNCTGDFPSGGGADPYGKP